MAWIRTVPPAEATGDLKRQYDAAMKRAGKVFQILQLQSLNPATMRAGIHLYAEAMFGESPLPRATRELLATVVSATNHCHY